MVTNSYSNSWVKAPRQDIPRKQTLCISQVTTSIDAEMRKLKWTIYVL